MAAFAVLAAPATFAALYSAHGADYRGSLRSRDIANERAGEIRGGRCGYAHVQIGQARAITGECAADDVGGVGQLQRVGISAGQRGIRHSARQSRCLEICEAAAVAGKVTRATLRLR